MKRYRITLEDRTFDVRVLDDPRQEEVRVEVDGESLIVGVEAMVSATEATDPGISPPGGAPTTRKPATEGVPPSSGVVTAPLPGVIKSIAVQSGQRVAAGETLVAIEAMKMENIIRAPGEGTIGTIHAAEGRQVAYGDPLLGFEVQDEA